MEKQQDVETQAQLVKRIADRFTKVAEADFGDVVALKIAMAHAYAAGQILATLIAVMNATPSNKGIKYAVTKIAVLQEVMAKVALTQLPDDEEDDDEDDAPQPVEH